MPIPISWSKKTKSLSNMTGSKKISPRLQLKDTHPTAIKIAKLCALAEELGISISFLHQRVIIQDKDRDGNLPPLFLEDIEDNHWFDSFPFETEYKLVYDNPEYLAQKKAEEAERLRLRQEELRAAKEKEERRFKEESEARAKALEARERQLLADLKEKYES